MSKQTGPGRFSDEWGAEPHTAVEHIVAAGKRTGKRPLCGVCDNWGDRVLPNGSASAL